MNKIDFNVDIAKRLVAAFPEAGLLTLTNMLGSYDQWRAKRGFYQNTIIKIIQSS